MREVVEDFVIHVIQFCHRFHECVGWCVALVKQHFFLYHVEHFLLDFLVQTIQKFRIILSYHCFSFIMIVDNYYSTYIPQKILAKTSEADCCVFDRFGWLSPVYWTQMCRDGYMFHLGVTNRGKNLFELR